MSEAELLESYNRWDNIRIPGVKEDRSCGNKVSESYSQSMQNILQLAEKVGANVASQDISITHRLPSRNKNKERPIIVKFSRRIAGIEMLQKKEHIGTLQDLKHVKIFEELTLPSLRFFKYMESDERIDQGDKGRYNLFQLEQRNKSTERQRVVWGRLYVGVFCCPCRELFLQQLTTRGTNSASNKVAANCITEVSSFDIPHVNCRSLIKHHEELEAFISKVESPHLTTLTETWLRVDDEPSCYLVNNNTKCLVNSGKLRGGGVIFQFCEDVILITELHCPFDENLAAQFSYFGQVYIVIVNYSPASVDKMVFVDHFELFLESRFLQMSYDSLWWFEQSYSEVQYANGEVFTYIWG